jgi:hypothetical protein
MSGAARGRNLREQNIENNKLRDFEHSASRILATALCANTSKDVLTLHSEK